MKSAVLAHLGVQPKGEVSHSGEGTKSVSAIFENGSATFKFGTDTRLGQHKQGENGEVGEVVNRTSGSATVVDEERLCFLRLANFK